MMRKVCVLKEEFEPLVGRQTLPPNMGLPLSMCFFLQPSLGAEEGRSVSVSGLDSLDAERPLRHSY